ncbi:hypothetical protein [Clostridium botulinum]|uniref:hypothetical protein n=1 Tax=Clostridium botulinum TaxID=1491 RepID=UPI0004DAC9C3|nr:hypothetical protein [Clostridium botulinum]KEI07113.1 hypothetical protein Z952_02430 [Clostridium botulinum C/D str. BKT75002]KEI12190.1 hypothetical protein Z954_06575 [Clostridium botulinum C/D str. BKT2873]QPW59542.1 hypothetical protein IG390_07235 [Clostridium botulinum]
MYWAKKRKPGFIIIFTLIVVSTLMLIMLYIFRIQLIRNSYNNIQKNILLKEEIYSKKRECVLTKLSQYIKSNMKEDMSDSSLNSILYKINENHINFQDVFVKFDNVNKNILIYFPNEKGTLRCEAYLCSRDMESNKLEINLISIQYVDEVIYKC